VRGGWNILLAWRRTLDILLPGTSLFRRSLFALLSRRFLHRLLLIVLSHDGVTRLVTVIPVMQLLLLLHLPGIPIL
jgi:hypothetical protein